MANRRISSPSGLSILPMSRKLRGKRLLAAKRAYLMGFNKAGLVSDGLAAAGVTLWQLEHWREIDKEFVDLERQALQLDDDVLRAKINEMIRSGNENIIKAAMKRLPEYSPVRKTELSVTGEVQHRHLATLEETELDKIIRAGAELVEAEWEEVGHGKAKALPGSMPKV